eukprot:363280-Chlamydomonas_euryale.AAC.2
MFNGICQKICSWRRLHEVGLTDEGLCAFAGCRATCRWVEGTHKQSLQGMARGCSVRGVLMLRLQVAADAASVDLESMELQLVDTS